MEDVATGGFSGSLAVNMALRLVVEQRLCLRWSPQRIAGWLRRVHPDDPEWWVSHETIYQSLFVQARGALKHELTTYLRTRRVMRRPRGGNTFGSKTMDQLRDVISIRERPAEVEDRAVPGHWEGDLTCGSVTLGGGHARGALHPVHPAGAPGRRIRTVSGTGAPAGQGEIGVVIAGRGRPTADPGLGRPRLRGWLHALVVPFTFAAVWLLWRSVGHLPLPQRGPAVVYGLTVVLLFSVSGVYHVPTRWSPQTRALLVRLDGAATVLLIVGTFVPVAAYSLEGAWRGWSLVGALVVALVGVALAVSSLPVPPHASAAAYVLAGWLAAIPMFRMAGAVPWPGLMLIVLGGVIYSIGALVFALRRPDPVPAWFGYHEVFHALVTVAAGLHFAAIWFYVLPLAA